MASLRVVLRLAAWFLEGKRGHLVVPAGNEPAAWRIPELVLPVRRTGRPKKPIKKHLKLGFLGQLWGGSTLSESVENCRSQRGWHPGAEFVEGWVFGVEGPVSRVES